MKNHETTLKNHGNQPKSMKNHETTLITHEKPTKEVLIFRYKQTDKHCIIIYISSSLSVNFIQMAYTNVYLFGQCLKNCKIFFVGHPAFHWQYCRFPIPHHHHYHQHLQYPRNLHDTKSWLTMHSCAQRKFQAFRKGENGKPRPLVHNFKFCGNLRSLWICFRKIRNLWTSTVYHPEKLQTKVLDM